MKTRNRRHPRSSRMDGDKSGESGAFLFSQCVPDICDGRRSFPKNENSNLFHRGCRLWISLITNPLNCWAPVPLSQINMASLENLGQIVREIGKIWDDRQKVKSPIVWDFPDTWKLGFRVQIGCKYSVKHNRQRCCFLKYFIPKKQKFNLNP